MSVPARNSGTPSPEENESPRATYLAGPSRTTCPYVRPLDRWVTTAKKRPESIWSLLIRALGSSVVVRNRHVYPEASRSRAQTSYPVIASPSGTWGASQVSSARSAISPRDTFRSTGNIEPVRAGAKSTSRLVFRSTFPPVRWMKLMSRNRS